MEIDLIAWGKILAAGTFGSILGKFATGWLADRFGGKFTFVAGLLVTSLGVATFAVSRVAWLFGLALFIALFAKSAGWPSMAKLIGNWFRPNQYGRVWGILSTSSRIGTIVATLALGALLAWLSWSWVVAVGVGLGGVAILFCLLTLRERPPEGSAAYGDREARGQEPVQPHFLDGTTLPEALTLFFSNRRFWLITGSLSGLTILWDFLYWVPFLFKDTLDLSESDAVMATAAFPVGSLVSVLVGGFIFDKLSRGKMALVMGGLLTIATGCILAFCLMPGWGLEKEPKVYLSIGLIFVFGLCMSPCYYLPMSVFSIEFGGIHSGFLIALLDAIAFGGVFVFNYFGGSMVDAGGWNLFLGVLLGISVWSVLTTFLFLLGESRARNAPDLAKDDSPTPI